MPKKIKILELFAGIHASSKALKNLGFDVETTAIEYDKKVVEISNALWDRQDTPKDVREFNGELNKYNLLVAGFPCQTFSTQGKRKGNSTLYKDTLRVIKETKPEYIVLENVKGITHKNNNKVLGNIFEKLNELNYKIHCQIISSEKVSAQVRERFFIYGSLTKKPKPIIIKNDKKIVLNDLNPTIERLKEFNIIEPFINGRSKIDKYSFVRENDIYDGTGKVRTLTATGANNNIKLLKNGKTGFLDTRTKFKLMGWKDKDFVKIKHLAKTNINKAAGNSMVIPVMEAIFKELIGGEKNG